jgi:hypothetical protein
MLTGKGLESRQTYRKQAAKHQEDPGDAAKTDHIAEYSFPASDVQGFWGWNRILPEQNRVRGNILR